MQSSLFPQNQPTQMANVNNPMQLISQFNQFKQSMQGKDPKVVLNNLIWSGQVSKAQVDQATQMANMFRGLLR